MALGVLREPAFYYALLLLMHFKDTPKAGEGESAEDGRESLIGYKKGCAGYKKAHGQPDPPALFPEVVLHLDNCRVAYADAEEHGRAYDNSTEMRDNSKYRFGRKATKIIQIFLEQMMP